MVKLFSSAKTVNATQLYIHSDGDSLLIPVGSVKGHEHGLFHNTEVFLTEHMDFHLVVENCQKEIISLT